MENPSRFVIFLLLAFSVLMVHAVVNQMLAPPGPPPEELAKDAQRGAPDAAPVPADEQPRGAERESTNDPAEPDSPAAPPEDAPPARVPAEPPRALAADAEPLQHPERWVVLGSLDPSRDNPFRLQAVFSSRGASIRRLALASPDFRDVDNRAGFLGHLEPIDAQQPSGCKVRAVGRGTPAERAGLRVGDIITHVNATPIPSADEFDSVLAGTRPKQQIRLTVSRDGQQIPDIDVVLGRRPLEVLRPEKENIRSRGEEPPPDLADPPSLLVQLQQLHELSLEAGRDHLPGIDLVSRHWEVVHQDETRVAFRIAIPEHGLEVVKRFEVPRAQPAPAGGATIPGYHVDMTLEFRNRAKQEKSIAYRLDGPTGLPTEGWWYANKIGRRWFQSVGLRDLAIRFRGAESELIGAAAIAEGDVEPFGQGRSLMYAGVDAQYFAAILIPQKNKLDDVWLRETRALRIGAPQERDNPRLTNVSCRLISDDYVLQPAGTDGHVLRQTYRLFAGPKRPDLLAQYGQTQDTGYSLKGLVYYGWFWWVAVPMLSILHLFATVLGNYGIAIICLTIVVRGCMFPLSLKQTRNMQKMQELQPEMKRIAEKYKGDMEKRTRAQQELFRKHNYNPMGGCLVLFLQLPIFIGLYRSLMVSVDLRQAPLISESIRWCSNLAAPDMLLRWTSVMPEFVIGLLGPYLNILPLLTVAIFLWQQAMFMPPPTDEQTALQQKMMKYMMVFIGFLFFKVASGLCLYFIASSLWGIAERKLLPKTPTVPSASESGARAGQDKPTSNGQPRGGRKKKQKQRPGRK